MTIRTRRSILAGAITVPLGSAWSCGKNPAEPSSIQSITDFFSSATTAGASQAEAAPRSGAPPSPAGGPNATVASAGMAVRGASNLITVQGSAPFQTILLSVGSAQSANASRPSFFHALAARSIRLIEADVVAAPIETSGFLQIDLPAPVTDASVFVTYSQSLSASSFNLQVQLAAPGGSAGPVASVQKTMATGPELAEMTGVVYGRLVVNPANPMGPGLRVDPVSGATVSTSLDSRTTVTDANGAFHLVTNTPGRATCFRVTITAAGYPTYSTDGWMGGGSPVIFTLVPAAPTAVRSCS